MNDFHKLVVIIVSLADSDCKQLMGLAVLRFHSGCEVHSHRGAAQRLQVLFCMLKVNASPDPKQHKTCPV